jgi:hypothetical protein
LPVEVNLELIHIAISLVLEVDADDLAGELATDGARISTRGCARPSSRAR